MEKTGIAIVMPARFSGSVEDSHCTLIYLGTTDTVTFTKDQVAHILYDLELAFGRNLKRDFSVHGTDWFGVDRDIPVMRLESAWLKYLRKVCETLLTQESANITSPSEWQYQPHVTLPQDYDGEIPACVRLTAPVLWWGDER